MDIPEYVVTADQVREIQQDPIKASEKILENAFIQIQKKAKRGLNHHYLHFQSKKFIPVFIEVFKKYGYSVETNGEWGIKISWE